MAAGVFPQRDVMAYNRLTASFISNANSFEDPLKIQCNFSNSIIYCLLSGEHYFEGLPFPIPYLWFTKW